MTDEPQPSDRELLRAWADGDVEAAEQIVERYFLMVYRFFATKTPQEADDLTQQTFSDFQRGVAGEKPVDNGRAYVMTCARNRLYMHLRSRGVERRVFDPAVMSVSVADPGSSPSAALARHGELQLLLSGLRSIPVESQLVLELYYWEEMPVREIAEVIGVAPGTVMSRLHRARGKLNAEIASLADDAAARAAASEGLETWAARVRAEVGGLVKGE